MEPAGPGPGEGAQALLAPPASGEACGVPACRPGAAPEPTSLCRLLCAPGVTARSGGLSVHKESGDGRIWPALCHSV